LHDAHYRFNKHLAHSKKQQAIYGSHRTNSTSFEPKNCHFVTYLTCFVKKPPVVIFIYSENLYLLKLVQTISGFAASTVEMIFDPSGRFLCTSGDDDSEFTNVWDSVTGQVIYRLKTSYHSLLAYSMNGQILVTGNLDGSIQVWDVSALQAPSP